MDWKRATDFYLAEHWDPSLSFNSNWNESVFPIDWPQLIHLSPPPLGATENEIVELAALKCIRDCSRGAGIRAVLPQTQQRSSDAFHGGSSPIYGAFEPVVHDVKTCLVVKLFGRIARHSRLHRDQLIRGCPGPPNFPIFGVNPFFCNLYRSRQRAHCNKIIVCFS